MFLLVYICYMYLLLDYQINKTLFKNIKTKTAISTRRTSLTEIMVGNGYFDKFKTVLKL